MVMKMLAILLVLGGISWLSVQAYRELRDTEFLSSPPSWYLQQQQTPTHVKAGGMTWTIKSTYVPGYLGFSVCDQYSIVLNPHMSPDKTREVLWHEIKHTAYCSLKEAIPVKEGESRKFTEEQAVDLAAAWEVQIMRDNPELVRYLTSQ